MLIRIHPQNPDNRNIQKVVDCLQRDGVIIYPTDTVYGIGCDINSKKAIERICKIKNIKPEKANFSFVCYDLSHLSDFTKSIDSHTFRALKKSLPGPFTFILPASNQVPKILHSKKKTVGIRIPDNLIARELVKILGNPVLSTSLHNPDDSMVDYLTDPELIHEKYSSLVDMVIDGGSGGLIPSTVIDCSEGELQVIREGKGDWTLIE